MATDCSQLKLQVADGKYYLNDVADTEYCLELTEHFEDWYLADSMIAS